MGGPCRLKGGEAAPECTSNFYVRPFVFDGATWHSVEQCYQAYKFADPRDRERIRRIEPEPREMDNAYGLRVWSEGQRRARMRPDWDATKVEIMLRAVRARYAQNADLAADLVATGDAELFGGPSTSWKGHDGREWNWSDWNGRIQMLVREELRPGPNAIRWAELAREFEVHRRTEGRSVRCSANALPLPAQKEADEAMARAVACRDANTPKGPIV